MTKIYIVVDKLLTSDDAWETHLASLLQGYVEAASLDNYSIEELSDMSVVQNYFDTKKITSQDIFVFTNSWSGMVTYIKHWSELYETPIKMIGFWPKGCFIGTDKEYRPLNERNWRKSHELANFRCLDKSLFFNESHKDAFKSSISKLVYPERLQVCKFPLDYLSLEISLTKDKYYKQDIIIFPWEKYSDLDYQIVYDFIRFFKDATVIFAQENLPLERNQLINQLSKAKVAFLPYTSTNIGQEIYECLLLETIPIVPDMEGFKELVPDAFRYPPEWTSNIFNYCQYAPDLTAKIKNIVDDYANLKPLIKEHQQYLTEYFYDSEQIIRELIK